MRLPRIENKTDVASETLIFKGTDTRGSDPSLFADSVNISFAKGCKTRENRKLALICDQTPDQIINCGDRVFLRNGNKIREIAKSGSNDLEYKGTEIKLSEYEEDTDRTLLQYDNYIFVFPDKLKINNNEENFERFEPQKSASVSMPFTNSRTLFYSLGTDVNNNCTDLHLLKAGTKVKFSFCSDKEYIIIKKEKAKKTENNISMNAGIRITLDKSVDNYKTASSTDYMMISEPKVSPMLNGFHTGYSNSVSFYENTISFSDIESSVTYTETPLDYLNVGQEVIISGSTKNGNNIKATVASITDTMIVFDKEFSTCNENPGNEIVITPAIPDFDYAVITDGRMFGADNKNHRFMISNEDTPLIFYINEKSKTEAWQHKINEQVMGMVIIKDNVVCFTESGGFKILGTNALNFAVSRIASGGVKTGKENSLVCDGETAFYMSVKGIMKYSKGSDIRISSPLPEKTDVFSAAVNHGYYLINSSDRIWVYDNTAMKWWSEDSCDEFKLFSYGGETYIAHKNVIYCYTGESGEVEWELKTAELPKEIGEDVKPAYLKLEATSTGGCEIEVFLRCRGASCWEKISADYFTGEKALKIPLKKYLCSGFFLKLKGSGQIEINNLTYYYRRKNKW